jgi:hypothetical protein
LIRTTLKGGKKYKSEKREEGIEKERKEKGKSEGKYTYPPTHHMCMKVFGKYFSKTLLT